MQRETEFEPATPGLGISASIGYPGQVVHRLGSNAQAHRKRKAAMSTSV
jgi:hypothetical protein